jgi:putative membrane protein
VLPSALQLFIYGAFASLGLVLVSKGTSGVVSFVPVFAVFVLSATAISSALHVTDRKTIANVRRVSALLVAGEVLLLAIGAAGAVYAWAGGSPDSVTSALVYGAFVCAGLEFLVVYGAFTGNAMLSLGLAALHPVATLLTIRFNEIAASPEPIPAVLGAVSLAIIVGFPLSLRRTKTSRGHDSLRLFRAFMKTWTAGYADELEGIIADHSEETEVTTKVLRFRSETGDFFLVLPGVHPGPFHPVGSYDLPGVVSRELREMGPVMTLHKPGGHEHNLATRADTAKYATEVRELAQSIVPSASKALVRGPTSARVDKAKASATAFSEDMLLTISFAPLGSDDFDASVQTELARTAAESGFDLSVVDAHNSIDHDLEVLVTDHPGWKQLFAEARNAQPGRFRVAYAHSKEVGFKGGRDVTENGIGLFMIQSGGSKSVLILADANNAVPALREEVSGALDSAGYSLIEFCTSDSHNLAARGLTVQRGYEALGEATPVRSIADLAVDLARLAEPRLSEAEYGSAQSRTKVRVFGSRALNEFAEITQASSKFSWTYFRVATFAVAALLLLSVAS